MKKIAFLLMFALSSLSANYSWLPRVRLSDPALESRIPSSALDPNGNAVAVWTAFNSGLGTMTIQAADKPFGQPWSAAQTISSPLVFSTLPLVVVDINGNAVALWIDNTGILSVTKLFGQPWSAVPDLIPAGPNVGLMDAVIDMNGKVTVIWYISAAGVSQVYSSDKTLVGAWTAQQLLSGLSTLSLFPAIGIDASGNIIGTWQDGQNIVAALKPFGLGWQLPATTIIGTGNSFAPQISVNPAGDAIVIAAGNNGVSTAYKPFNQPWNPFETIPGSTLDPNSHPTIGIDSHDNAVAFWNNGSHIATSTKIAGQPWSTSSLFAPGSDALVDVNSCDLALVGWRSHNLLFVSSGMIGGSFSAPFSLGEEAGAFSLDQNPCGHAMVVLTSPHGTPTDIVAVESSFIIPTVSSFSGFQKKNDVGTMSDYENHLQWTFTATQNIRGFQIYRNGSPIKTVKPNEDDYVDPQQKKKVPVQYGIAVIEPNGAETSQTTTIVP